MNSSSDSNEDKWRWIEENTGFPRDRYIDALGFSPAIGEPYRNLQVGEVDRKRKCFVLYHNQRHEIQYLFRIPERDVFIDRVDMRGVGKEVFERLLTFCSETGLANTVSLFSGKDGPYVWARYGFLPSQQEWDSLRTSSDRLVKAFTFVKDNIISPTDPSRLFQKVQAILENQDPKAIRQLAKLEDEIILRGSRSGKIGKWMLNYDGLGRSFSTFNIQDPETLKEFKEYEPGRARVR